MLAVVIPSHGGPGVLKLEDRPCPPPGAGEVRVRVEAAGVNFADVLCRLGVYAAAPPPPLVPGIEIAGVVEAAGPGVDLEVGTPVFGFTEFGGQAEQVVVPESFLSRRPEDLSVVVSAGLPVRYLTAWYGLDVLGRLAADETVLVTAAAGGVGLAALELAGQRRAGVVALVGSEAKAEVVRRVSPRAQVVVGGGRDLAAGLRDRKVDVVLDSVGGAVFRSAWRRLAPGGRYVLCGAASAVGRGALSRLAAGWRLLPMAAVNPLAMITGNRSLAAFNLFFLARSHRALLQRGLEEILGLLRQGRISAEVAEVRPVEEVVEVHRRLQARETVGKIVLDLSPTRGAAAVGRPDSR